MDGIYVNPSFVGKEDTKYKLVGSVKRKQNLMDSIKMFWLLYKPRKRRRTIDEIRYIKTKEFTETLNNIVNIKLNIPNRDRKSNKDGRKPENKQKLKTKSDLSVPKSNVSLEQLEALFRLMVRTEQDEYKIMQARLLKRKIEKIRQIDFANVSFEKLQEVYDEIVNYEKTHGEQLKGIDTSLIQEFVTLKEEIFGKIKIVLLNDMRKLEEKTDSLHTVSLDKETKKETIKELKGVERDIFNTVRKYFAGDGEITVCYEKLQAKLTATTAKLTDTKENGELGQMIHFWKEEKTVLPPHLAETFKMELLNDMNKVEERVNQFTEIQFDDATKKVSVEDLESIEKALFKTIKKYFLDDAEVTNRFENLHILIASVIAQVTGKSEESVSQAQAVPQKVKCPGEKEAQ